MNFDQTYHITPLKTFCAKDNKSSFEIYQKLELILLGENYETFRDNDGYPFSFFSEWILTVGRFAVC